MFPFHSAMHIYHANNFIIRAKHNLKPLKNVGVPANVHRGNTENIFSKTANETTHQREGGINI